MISKSLPSAVFATVLLLAPLAIHAEDEAGLDIAPQPLNAALREFAERSGLQVMYAAEIGEGVNSPGTSEAASNEEALGELLASTGLGFEYINERTVAIQLEGQGREGSASGNSRTMSSQTAMEQASSSDNDTGGAAAAERIAVPEVSEDAAEKLEEIIVTGSRLISDPGKLTRQITVFNRDEIERSGATRLDEFLRRLPQSMNAPTNVGSGFTPMGSDPNFGLGNNLFAGSTINLRGLGSQYTLILINGRRPARGGQFGTVTDISNIPIERVERIEILFDGAAAIYGADAIGGVVNIITNRDYDGTHVSLTYSDTEDGGGARYNLQLGHTFNWGSGSLTGSVSYQTQEQIDGSQRPDIAFDNSSFLATSSLLFLPPSANGNVRGGRLGLDGFRPLFWVSGDQRLSGGAEVPALQQVWNGTAFELIETTTIVDRQNPVLPPTYFWIDEAAHKPQNPETLGFTPIFRADLPQYNGQPLSNDDINANNELGESVYVPFEGQALSPEDETYSIALAFTQDFSENLSLNLNLDYTVTDKLSNNFGDNTNQKLEAADPGNPFKQDFDFAFQNVFPQQYQNVESTSYNISGGIDWHFSEDWSLSFGFGVSEQEQDSDTINYLRRGMIGPDYLDARLRGFYFSGFDRVPIGTNFNDPLLGYDSVEELTGALVVPFMSTYNHSEYYDTDVRLLGKLFELPGGDVRTSLSAKYREDKSVIFDNNPLVGNNFTGPLSEVADSGRDYEDAFGENVKSLAGELSVPVFGEGFDLPLVERLLLSFSGSVEEYSNTDENGFNWAAGFNWGVNEAFVIRLNRTHNLRVPESVRTAREPRWLRSNSFPVYNDVNDDFPVQVNQILWRITGGANHLEPERNYGTALSFIYRPSFAEGLDIQLNLTQSHTVDQLGNPYMGKWTFDTISPEGVSDNPLFAFGDPENDPFHAAATAVQRDPVTGQILPEPARIAPGELIYDARIYNIGDTFNRGADIQVRYSLTTGFGDWFLTWRHQYLDVNEVTRSNLCDQVETGCVYDDQGAADPQYGVPIDTAGSVSRDNYSNLSPLPKNRGSVDLFWDYRGLGVNLSTQYTETTSIFKTREFTEWVIVDYIEFNGQLFPIFENQVVGTNIYREDTTPAQGLDVNVSYDFGRGSLFDAPGWLGDARISLAIDNLFVSERKQRTTIVQNEVDDQIGNIEDINPFTIRPRGKSYSLHFSTTF